MIKVIGFSFIFILIGCLGGSQKKVGGRGFATHYNNICSQSESFKSFVSTKGRKVVLFFSYRHCMDCIITGIEKMHAFIGLVEEGNLAVVSNFMQEREFRILLNTHGVYCSHFNIASLNNDSKLEYIEFPIYYFIDEYGKLAKVVDFNSMDLEIVTEFLK